MSYEIIKGLLVAGCIWMVFSYLYKENVIFRFAEHIYIGLGIGYVLYQAIERVIGYVWTPLTTKGEWVWLIPLFLGLITYTRFTKTYKWISRWPVMIVVGSGVGLAMSGLVVTMIVTLIVQTITLDFKNISNLIFLIITFTTIAYFIFTREQTGLLGNLTKIGRIGMMAAFGASMASNVFAFCSLLGGAIGPLVIYPGYYITLLVFIIIIIDYIVGKKK